MRSPTHAATVAIVLLAAATAAAPALVDEALAQSSPSIEGIDSPGLGGTYGTGRIVNITISFDEAVYVEGVPAIGLAIVPERNATYASGSGTSTLSFLYTVQPGDAAATLAYTSLPPSSGGSAAIRNAEGNAANMSAPGVAQGVQPPPVRDDVVIDGARLPVLAAAGNASDGEGTPGIPGTPTFDRLGGAAGVAAFELGKNGTFAVVASRGDNAVQLVQILEDGALRAVSTLNNTGTLELNGAISVDTIYMGEENGTFAIVASQVDDGVQLIRIHENGTMEATAKLTDGGALSLNGARSVDAFWTAGGHAFALVAAEDDYAVQLIRISGDGAMTGAHRLIAGRYNGAADVFAYRAADGTTLALATSSDWGGVNLLRINEAAGTMAPIGAAYTARGNDYQALGAAGYVTVLGAPGDGGEGAGGRLALVTPLDRSSLSSIPGIHDAVSVLRVYDNGTSVAPTPGYVVDGQTGLEWLRDPRGLDSFTMGGRMYAVVASQGDSAVQMIRVHADGRLEGAGSVVDGHGGPNGFAELAGAHGIDVFEMDGRKYAIVASQNDNGVQLMRLSPPSVANVTASLQGGMHDDGQQFNVTVEFDAPVTARGPAPSLMLAFDGGVRAAEYLDGNGTGRLVFGYTLRTGESATDGLRYAGPAALTTRGIIVDVRGAEGAAAADLELPDLGDGWIGGSGPFRVVDSGRPHVVSAYSPDAEGAYGTGRIINITAVLDRPVTVYGEPRLHLNAGLEAYASYAGGNGTDKLHFQYSVMPGDGAARLDYAGTGALSLPEGGYVSYGSGGTAADLQALPPPGSPGSLTALGSDQIAVIGGPLPILRPNGTATDNSGGYNALRGAIGVDVVEDGGGGAYALVAASTEPATAPGVGGVQLIRIHPNGTLSPGGLDRDDSTFRLNRPTHVAAFEMGGLPRALVPAGNSISLYDMGPGGALSLNNSANNVESTFDRLGGAKDASVFEAYNDTYAVVSSSDFSGTGLQLVRILPNGTLLANGSAVDGNGFLLASPGSVDALDPADGDAAAADRPRVLVTSSDDNAVQLVSIHPDGDLSVNGSATNGTDGFDALAGASDVAVFGTDDGRTHAVATSALGDSIQLIRIHPDGTLAAAGSAFNGTAGGFDTLGHPQDVDVFEMGGWPYALVTSFDSDGIQLVLIDADDGAFAAVGSARDADDADGGGFTTLGNADGVAAFDAGNITYALVASHDDHGVQMIRLTPASAAGVSSQAGAGPHPVGKMINITVSFDESVKLEDPSRPPSLLLSLDGTTRAAPYLSGNGTAELVFNYTVRPGDATPLGGALEYAHAGALVSRGAITDLRGEPADLELPGPHTPGSLGQRGIAIDGVQPYAVSVSSPNASGTYAPGDGVLIAVNFSKAVNVTDVPTLEIELDGANGNANYTSGSGGKVLTFLYTVRAGDEAADLRYAGTDALSLDDGASSIRDAVGNDAIRILPDPAGRVVLSDGSPGAITIDGVGPRVASVTEASPKGAPYRAGEEVKIAVALDEPAELSAGFNSSLRLALDGGEDATAGYERRSDDNLTLVYSYEVQPGDAADPLDYDGPNALSVSNGSAADALDNPAALELPGPPGDARPTLAAAGIRIDTERPRVDSVSSPNADRTYGVGSEINVTVTFGEAVYVTGSPQIELETGQTDRRASYDSGGGSQTLVFVYAVLPNDLTGDLEYAGPDALSLNGGTIGDAAGNPAVLRLPGTGSPASLGGSKDIAVDATEPPSRDDPAYVVSVFSDRGGSYYAGSAVNITVAFSRAVDVTGTPLLRLSTTPPRNAEYAAGDGGAPASELAFRYVVQEGDMADRLNYAGTGALTLNGGAITYAGGRAANLALPPVDSARSLRDSGIAIGTAIDGGTGTGTDGGTDGGTTPPPTPVAPTCSLGLGMPNLAVEASPGNYSKAVQQVVKNAGSGAFVRVELEATQWYIDPSSTVPEPGAPSLPASLTVMSTDGQDGPFAPLPASGASVPAAAVAHGLAGGADYSLWLRINLTGHDRVDGTELVQRVTYTAECGGPPPP